MSYSRILTEVPEPENSVIGRIREIFRIEKGRSLELKHCVKEGNSAGYYCDFVYHGFDPRELDASQEPRAAWREFMAIWTLPHLEGNDSFGLRVVFHKGDPAYSEGFNFREPIPEHLSEFSEFLIRDLIEENR